MTVQSWVVIFLVVTSNLVGPLTLQATDPADDVAAIRAIEERVNQLKKDKLGPMMIPADKLKKRGG